MLTTTASLRRLRSFRLSSGRSSLRKTLAPITAITGATFKERSALPGLENFSQGGAQLNNPAAAALVGLHLFRSQLVERAPYDGHNLLIEQVEKFAADLLEPSRV